MSYKVILKLLAVQKASQFKMLVLTLEFYTEFVTVWPDKAKVSQEFINGVQDKENGKLILVTAINPTPAGEGKTTTTVGLGDGLNKIGKNATIVLEKLR